MAIIVVLAALVGAGIWVAVRLEEHLGPAGRPTTSRTAPAPPFHPVPAHVPARRMPPSSRA